MTVTIAMANSIAIEFRAAMRRMLAGGFTNSNLPAANDRGATASQVENLRLYLPIVSADVLLELSRAGSTRASATDAAHPRFNSRAHGRFRFDVNRAVLTKRDDQVESTHERRRCSGSAKSRLSPRLRAYSRSNRNAARLALDSWLDPAPPALGSSSAD